MESGDVMKAKLNNVSILLNEPSYPENIGASARVVKNMGLGRLIVVRPKDCDLSKVLRMATHNAEDVVSDMEVHEDLRDALLPFHHVVGTTARRGGRRTEIRAPRDLAGELIEISQENRVVIMFGAEASGLTNDHLRYCDTFVTIPTADFTSLNLSQAVMVMAYELFTTSIEKPRSFVPRLANRNELEGMYDHLRDTLAKINFINPENPDYWMVNVRRFFSRVGLRARDVKIIRGICRQMDWYCRNLEQSSCSQCNAKSGGAGESACSSLPE